MRIYQGERVVRTSHLDEEHHAVILELFLADVPLKAIAALMNTSVSIVSTSLSWQGSSPHAVRAHKQKKRQEVIDRLKIFRGLDYEQISKLMGLSKSTTTKISRRELPRRDIENEASRYMLVLTKTENKPCKWLLHDDKGELESQHETLDDVSHHLGNLWFTRRSKANLDA